MPYAALYRTDHESDTFSRDIRLVELSMSMSERDSLHREMDRLDMKH